MYVYSVIFFLFLDFFLHFYFSFSLCHLPSSNENWTGSIRSYQKGSIHRNCGLYMLLFHLVCDRFSGISHLFNHQWSNNKWRCKYLTPIYPLWMPGGMLIILPVELVNLTSFSGFHFPFLFSIFFFSFQLKGSFSSKGGQRNLNPYSRGNICLNCCHILCGPMTPSLIDR